MRTCWERKSCPSTLNDKCFALNRCIFFPNLIRISQLCQGPFLLKRRERENKCMIQWAVFFWIPPLLLYFVNSRTPTRCTRRLENFWERYFNSPYRQIKLGWSHSFHNEQKKNYFPFSNYLGNTLHSHFSSNWNPSLLKFIDLLFPFRNLREFFFIRLINVSSFKCKLVTSCVFAEPPEISLWESFFLPAQKPTPPRYEIFGDTFSAMICEYQELPGQEVITFFLKPCWF